ncbi:autophagy protein Apg6-domain-containing protein [Pilobolus umbonatus]|nr:autophagy protein Apg6-domain-containing protein [Pilobolus umbonatus]
MSLTCQRCRQPLRIDDSLINIDQAAADMLIAPLIAEEQHEQEERKKRTGTTLPIQPITRRLVGIKPSSVPSPSRLKRNSIISKQESFPISSESFVVLTKSQASPIASPANRLNPKPISSHSSTSTHSLHTTSTTVNNNTINHNNIFEINTSDSMSLPAQSSTASRSSTLLNDDLHGARNNSLSHRLKVATRLFDVMSSKSSVDHPMCQECTDMLLESLEKELEDVSHERDCYIDFLKKVKDNRMTKEEEDVLKNQVKELKIAEEEANVELSKLKQEENALNHELESLENEMNELERRKEGFWEKSNEYQMSLQSFRNERDSINLKYDHDVKQYERLQKTVVYNDAFCISHDGPFGTINGFRLGRLHTHPVDWNEVNAAWGQTLLLLYTVANKLKFQFKNYRLIPMGSFSRVEKIDGDSVLSYELYGSGDFVLNRMFLNRRFDHAMVAVLNCLKQLTDFAEEKDKSLRLPYRINKDRIGDLSIRLQFNQEEHWTKALKYMLTNMKWILVFTSRANVSNESSNSELSN